MIESLIEGSGYVVVKRKIKKFILGGIICLLLLGLVLDTHADSGFDTSYDSGSSSSSSSSSRSHSYSGSSDSGDGTGSYAFFVFLFIVFLVEFGHAYYWSCKKDKEVRQKLLMYIPNGDEKKFLEERFKDYVEIQKAWMNFDYEMLRKKVTDELYNQYEMQLETLQIKKQRNVMSEFEYVNAKLESSKVENDQVAITLWMGVKMLDYIEQNGEVVRGSKYRRINITYRMTFVCSQKPMNNVCPNCGAKYDIKAARCDYCNSVITGLSNDWVLSKKEAKHQTWE